MFAAITIPLPWVYAALLLLAGLLLGIALTQGLCSSNPDLESAARELRLQNAELQESLRHHRDAYAALERKHAEQREQTLAMSELQFRIESSLREYEIEHQDLERGLQAIQEIRQRALRDLDTERRTRVQLEAQLQSTEESLREVQHQLSELASERDRLRAQQDRLALQSKDWEQQLALLQQERDEARARYANERQQREVLDQLLLHQDLQQLTWHTAEVAEPLRQRLAHFESRLEAQDEELEQLIGQRDQARQALAIAHRTIDELRHDLESHQRTLAVIERQRQAEASQLSQIQNETSHLQALLAEQAEWSSRWEKSQTELAAARQQIATLQARLAELNQDLQHQRLEEKSATDRALALQADNDALLRRLQDHEKRLDQLRSERRSLADSLKIQGEQQSVLVQRLEAQSEEIERLRVELQEAHSEQQALQEAREELRALRQQMVQRSERAAVRHDVQAENSWDEPSRTAELERTIIVLREQLRMAQVQVQATLLRHVSTPNEEKIVGEPARQQPPQRTCIVDPAHPQNELLTPIGRGWTTSSPRFAPAEAPQHSEIQTLNHPRRGVIYLVAPEHPDNLCVIDGLDRSLQQRLNDLGVYTLGQIADWDAVAIEEFSRLLGTNDLIARQDWPRQAALAQARGSGEHSPRQIVSR